MPYAKPISVSVNFASWVYINAICFFPLLQKTEDEKHNTNVVECTKSQRSIS